MEPAPSRDSPCMSGKAGDLRPESGPVGSVEVVQLTEEGRHRIEMSRSRRRHSGAGQSAVQPMDWRRSWFPENSCGKGDRSAHGATC